MSSLSVGSSFARAGMQLPLVPEIWTQFDRLLAEWRETPSELRMEVLETHIQRQTADDRKVALLAESFTSEEKASLATFIGRCVAASGYFRTFHVCYPELERDEKRLFNTKFTREQPENALMVAPFVKLGELFLDRPLEDPRYQLSTCLSKKRDPSEPDDVLWIFPTIFDSFESVTELLTAVVSRGEPKVIRYYFERLVTLCPDLLVPHLGTLHGKTIIELEEARALLDSGASQKRVSQLNFFQTLDERREQAEVVRESKRRRPYFDSAPHDHGHSTECLGCKDTRLYTEQCKRRADYLLTDFTANTAPLFESPRLLDDFLVGLWDQGLPVLSHFPALGKGKKEVRSLINHAQSGRLSPALVGDLKNLIALGEPSGALRLLIETIRDDFSDTENYLAANLPTVLDWFEPKDQRTIVRQLLVHEPAICIPRLDELVARELVSYPSLIRACCDSTRHHFINLNLDALAAHISTKKEAGIDMSGVAVLVNETLQLELRRSPTLLLEDRIGGSVLSETDRREAVLENLRRAPSPEFIAEVVSFYEEGHFRCNGNPAARSLVLSLPNDEVRAHLIDDPQLLVEISMQHAWQGAGQLMTPDERDRVFISGLDETNSREALRTDDLIDYLRENPKFLTAVIERIEALNLDYLLPDLADNVKGGKVVGGSPAVARQALVRACSRNPQLACDRDSISVLKDEAKTFIQRSASDYLRETPQEVMRLSRYLAPGQLASTEPLLRRQLAFADRGFEMDEWLKTVRKEIGEGAYEAYLELNPMLRATVHAERTRCDWYDAVLLQLESLPLTHDLLPPLRDIAKSEQSMYGERPEIDVWKRHDDFVDLVELAACASNSELAKLYLTEIQALPAPERRELLGLMALAYRFGLDAELPSDSTFDQCREQLSLRLRTHLAQLTGIGSESISTEGLDGDFVAAAYSHLISTCRNYPVQLPALQLMLRWTTSGNFDEYRAWGGPKPASVGERAARLKEMQDEGLLPRGLTLDQYEVWCTDESTSLSTEIDLKPDDLRRGARRILAQAVADRHAPAEILHGDVHRTSHRLEELFAPIASLQEEIGSLDRAFKEAKDAGQPTAEIRTQWTALKRRADSLRAEQSEEIDRTESELALATFMSPGEQDLRDGRIAIGRWRRTITQLFATLDRVMGSKYPVFRNDLARLHLLFNEVREFQLGQRRISRVALNVHDRVDAKRYFFIGEKPVRSCQHYKWDQEHNRGLLSYVLDPNVRFIQIDDGAGRIIARAALRLLEDEDGQPQLFVERIYSSNQHEAVFDAIYEFAHQKAERMGVGLYSHSLESDFEIDDANVKVLSSRGSRTGYVYSDAAGGIKIRGVYRITGAFRLVRGVSKIDYARSVSSTCSSNRS